MTSKDIPKLDDTSGSDDGPLPEVNKKGVDGDSLNPAKPATPISWDEIAAALTTEGKAGTYSISRIAAFDAALDHATPAELEEQFLAVGDAKPTRSSRIVAVVDLASARLRELNADLMYQSGMFRSYVGSHWQSIPNSIVRGFLSEYAFRLGVPVGEASYHRVVDDLERQAISKLAVEVAEPRARPFMMNFPNGTLEIAGEGLTWRPHRKEDLLTYVMGCNYEPSATANKFQEHLDRVLPPKESQANLAEFFGTVFTDHRHEKALVLYGDGNNGKSVTIDIIAAAIGEYNVTHQSMESLNSEYYRASLAGFVLNIVSEIGRSPRADILKKIVSGEPVDARLPYGKPFILRKSPRLAFSCNELPQDVEHSDAFFRRLLIIPFTERIHPMERVPGLAKEIIESELSGVINWILVGLRRFIAQRGFTTNQAADAAVKEYRLDSDSVALFIQQSPYAPSDNGELMKLTDLHAMYRDFCKDNIYRPVSSRTMNKRLKALGFESTHKKTGTFLFAAFKPASVGKPAGV
jgi:putative DNA primase/helicase